MNFLRISSLLTPDKPASERVNLGFSVGAVCASDHLQSEDPRRENRFSENRLSEISDAYFRLEIRKN